MIRRKCRSICFYIGLVIIWQLVYHLGVNVFEIWKEYSFPNPISVFDSLYHLTADGSLSRAVIYSLRRAVFGFFLSICIGGIVGILMEISTCLKTNLKPMIIGVQSLPSICWVPFAILWFGLKESAIIFVVFIGSIFSVVLAFINAIEGVPEIYVKVARTMGASKRDILIKVMFPAAFPSFLLGLKQSWSFAWRALMSGEVLSSCCGLGYTLMLGREWADINQVMAIMIVIIIVGTVIDKLLFANILNRLLYKVSAE